MENVFKMDHYEKQLYSLFKSFDYDDSGTLDRDALTSLCNTLQLEERGTELVNRLLSESSDLQISFAQFRDGLLLVLGDEFSNNVYSDDLQSNMDSPGREVSPKYVYGTKKYGRRSRPQINPMSIQDSAYNNDSASSNSLIAHTENRVQRSLSHSDCVRRRISNEKLKRCISFPGNKKHDSERIHNKENLSNSNCLNKCVSNCIVDLDEVRRVCDNLGILNNNDIILMKIFHRLKDNSGKVEINEFLFHFEGEIEDEESTLIENTISTEKISDNKCSAVLCYGEYQMETIQSGEVIEMWELAGVPCPQQLLIDLGFNELNIKLSELLTVLDEEIKMVYNHSSKDTEPSLNASLLQATLCLHQYEIKTLKIEINQIMAERDKLRNDLNDANLRAQMIAQEVDENQLRMEASLKNRIKQGEQKHTDHIRELSKQLLSEKDTLSSTISKHENKIVDLEMEDQKNKILIVTLQTCNEKLDKEVSHYQEKIFELERVKLQLSKELKSIKSEKELWQSEDAKHKSSEINLLMEKLSEVQLENKNLKDRNDELSIEVECLQSKISSSGRCLSLTKTTCAVDISGEEAVSWSAECHLEPLSYEFQTDLPGGYGVKRRNNNEDSDTLMSEEESPRISKVRKCHKREQIKEVQSNQEKAETDLNISNDTWKCTSESGFECDGGSGSDGSSGVDRLNLEHILEKIKSNKMIPLHCHRPLIKYMIQLWQDIKATVEVLSCSCDPCAIKIHLRNICIRLLEQNDIELMFALPPNADEGIKNECEELKSTVKELQNKLEESNKLWLDEKERLTKQCNEFESSIEMMRSEYEKCEDYWQSKLEEERVIFDQEQRISDEKFSELFHKMTEYEEQFAANDKSYGHLSTIEERYSLERQFTDLEDELESYKKTFEEQIKAKNVEIESLTQQLERVESEKNNLINEQDNLDKFPKLEETTGNRKEEINNSISNNPHSHTDNVPFDSKKIVSPIEYLWNQSTIQLDLPTTAEVPCDSTTRDYHNPAFNVKAKQLNDQQQCLNSPKNPSLNTKIEWDKEKSIIKPISKPDSPIRCKSADAIKKKTNQRDFSMTHISGDVHNFCHTKQLSSMNCEQVMLHCSDLENHLLRFNGIHNSGFYNGSCSSMPESFAYEQQASERIMMLEHRCLQLQLALRQQQAYSDTLVQQAWNSAQVECNMLRARLSAADILVQQLYMDNCRLVGALTASSLVVQPRLPPSTTS